MCVCACACLSLSSLSTTRVCNVGDRVVVLAQRVVRARLPDADTHHHVDAVLAALGLAVRVVVLVAAQPDRALHVGQVLRACVGRLLGALVPGGGVCVCCKNATPGSNASARASNKSQRTETEPRDNQLECLYDYKKKNIKAKPRTQCTW